MLVSVLLGGLSQPAFAQAVAPPFNSVYTIHPLGSVSGLPTNYGGLQFKEGDPNTLLMGGQANAASGRIYAVPVTRGAGNHIASFGTPVAQGYGAYNDSGISYGPGGVLFYSKYNINQIGQVKPGANADSKVTDLGPLGVTPSPGAIVFVPSGLNGAGKLKISSYGGGQFYDIPYTPDGTGTNTLGSATLVATLAGGPEGLIYAPTGSPLFTNQTLLVTEYSANKVAAYDTDANGNPIVATRRDFITGLSGGEGAAIDPVTGDFLFSTFGGGNQVIQIRGFKAPPPAATVAVTSSLNPSHAGRSVTFTATVTGFAPVDGTVTFKDNGTDIVGCVTLVLNAGTAACTTTLLPAGTRTITAYYSGNATNSASSGSVTQTVNNTAPVAGPLSIQTFRDKALSGLLVASDVDGDALTFSLVSQPAHGTLTLTNAATGAVTYTPAAGYTGTDSFQYKANDGSVDSNTVTASINVLPVPTVPNLPPVANQDSYSTTKNVKLTVAAPGVLANDADPESHALSVVTLPSAPAAHGTVTSTSGGGFTYTPNANYLGLDSFQYTITDGTATATGTVVVEVKDTNSPPVAHDDSYSTPNNVKLVVPSPGLLANDSDPDGSQPLRVVVASQPTKGTLVLTAGGGFEYTPAPGLCSADSTDTFTYYANDGTVNSNLATVTITIHCTNRAPVANADKYTIAQGATLAVPRPGTLVNDTDADGNPLTMVVVTPAAKGPFAPNADGSFSYVAPSNFTGTDTFTYKATDGALESAPVTVTITITATNQPPLAQGDSYRTGKNTALTIAAPGLLANDTDPDGNLLTVFTESLPTKGVLRLDTGGGFTYTPNNNVVGLDSFTYRAGDGSVKSNLVTVTLEVADANFPPVANDDSYSTPDKVKLVVPAPGLLANDRDPDANQPLAAVIASQPAKGVLALKAGGGFEYTPGVGPCNADTTDSFTYYANDSVVNSNLATVTIAIHCTNRAPVANADSYNIAQGATLTVPPPGALVNDKDPDGNPLTMVVVTPAAKGPFAPHPDGSFSYVAPSNFTGTDTFTYKATDGALESAPVTVTINITASNKVPLAQNDSYRTSKNVALIVAPKGLLANDNDPDGNPLTVFTESLPTKGVLRLDTGGGITYTPGNNFVGLDSFTYRAGDGSARSNLATVVIDVADGNAAPVAANDSFATPDKVKLVVPGPGLLANDSDPDGNQPLTVVIASQPTRGKLALTSGGGFEYTPNPVLCSADSTDSFTYYANDSVVNSNLATVSIVIHCGNQPPVANPDRYVVAQTVELAVPAPGVLANDGDPDGNGISMVMVTPPTKGAYALHPDGSFVYTAPKDFTGIDTYTYKATDGVLESAPATVTIEVVAKNTPPLSANDSYRTSKNVALVVNDPGLVANDLDPDGNRLFVLDYTNPGKGTLHLQGSAGFVYTPNKDYAGLDSFTYAANDGLSSSGYATVVIEVTSSNSPPVANDDTFAIAYSVTTQVPSPGLIDNDTDPDAGQPLRAVIATQPAKGTVQLSSGGGFTYQPSSTAPCTADLTDRFTYYANDSIVNSVNPATVTLLIHCTNSAPVAVADAYAVIQGTQLTITAPGLLANDSDPNGNTLQAVIATQPANGVLTPSADGSFRYTPNAGFLGADSFTYKATDGALQSAPATVTITVVAPATPPACGPSNGVPSAFKPENLCAPGTPGSVVAGPTWTWSCAVGTNTTSCSAPNGPTSTGSGNGRIELGKSKWRVRLPESAGFIPVTGHPKSPPILPGITFPHGLIDFVLDSGPSGSSATVVITFPTPLPPGTVYWKYGPTPDNAVPHWYAFPGAVISGNTITLTIRDGGLGDDDLAANSVIVDQGGPGVPAGSGAVGIPTLSEWGMILLTLLMALAGLGSLSRRATVRRHTDIQ